ncbi:hypothetical protein Bpfe_021599 [Biomphalaria pfeifferi]|uniref:Uncharacterized protein n=1 Tax=Biomphalaria pfeifferi TaxID=112525 RepID=A0AAD8B7V9_BIOPF|nr:hypothetical protein Bpfe_021599 [Biomphalaria pfeifferi]
MRLIPFLLSSTLWSWCLFSIPQAAGQWSKSIGWGGAGNGKRSMDARGGSELRIIGRPDFSGFSIQLFTQDKRLDGQMPMSSWSDDDQHLDGPNRVSSWNHEDQHLEERDKMSSWSRDVQLLDGQDRMSSLNHEDLHLDGQETLSIRNDESVESDNTKVFLLNFSTARKLSKYARNREA